MSSYYVRQMVEGWLQDAAMATPYYATVNREENPQDDVWMTADFGASYRETMTFCDGMTQEDGEVEVVFFGRPGIGYDDVIQALEADMDQLLSKRDPQGKLVLLSRSAPIEFSRGSAKAEYAASCIIEYQYFA